MAQTIAGRFSLLDLIARGGSGAVWIARDERFGTVCAAKVLEQRDSASLLRFVRENTVRLDHPHVLAPYAWAAEDADVVIGMPLITGGTLDQALKDHGALSPRLVLAILQQCLLGLDAVHAAGWIHRDVKPGNIMFDAEQERLHVVIADFGIALHADDARLTHVGLVSGTPGYVAPEVMSGAAPDPLQDIWALGQCGKRMAGAEYGLDELRHAGGEAAGLGGLLTAMTAADPRQRISAEQAITRLAAMDLSGPYRCADGQPFAVLRVVESPSLPRQRHPGLAQVPGPVLAPGPVPGRLPEALGPDPTSVISTFPPTPPTHSSGRIEGDEAGRGRRWNPMLISAGVLGALGLGFLAIGAIGLAMT